MKFNNFLFPISYFLFPQADTPANDGRVVGETLVEAVLCDQLGLEMLWLAEHHLTATAPKSIQ